MRRTPQTLATRHDLALAYHSAGRVADAIAILQALLADRERVLGEAHPGTLATRRALADAYRAAGRPEEAAAIRASRGRRNAR